MILREPFSIAVEQLRAHKLRAMLSILGILISVGSITGIVSLGDGLQATVTKQFEQRGGPSLMWVSPPPLWYRNEKGIWVRHDWEEYLENRDIAELEAASPDIEFVVPVIQFSDLVQYRKITATVQLWASNQHLLRSQNWEVAKGRFITDHDVVSASKVVVLGAELAEDLFGDADPIGKEVRGDGERYNVVGVLKPAQFVGDSNVRNAVVPYTTIQLRHTGNDRLVFVTIKAVSPERVAPVVAAVKRTLQRRHEHGAEFVIETGESEIEQFNQVVTIMKLAAGGIAGISLLVGGIGIMNIMLVSVAERTREIGLRKALGARRRTILSQFLVESMVLCLFGGGLGIILGIGLGNTLEFLIAHSGFEVPFTSEVTPWLMAFAAAYSAMIGIFFGVYPAFRAARLDPVVALRK